MSTGNDGYWEFSAGESEDDSEWVVLDQNDWTNLGSHPHNFQLDDIEGCMNETACNYDANATLDDGSCTYAEENFDCAGNCLVDTDCAGNWWYSFLMNTDGPGIADVHVVVMLL